MAEVSTVQKKLEDIAERNLNDKIEGLKSYIKKAGLEPVFDKIQVVIKGGPTEETSLWFSLNEVSKIAREIVLPKLIEKEVSAFMEKVDNLSEQIDELRGSIEQGGY